MFQVQGHHVGLVPEDRAQRGVDVAHLRGDAVNSRLTLEDQAQAGADHRVVVREDDADLVRHGTTVPARRAKRAAAASLRWWPGYASPPRSTPTA